MTLEFTPLRPSQSEQTNYEIKGIQTLLFLDITEEENV